MGLGANQEAFRQLNPTQAESLRVSMDSWFQQSHDLAVQAIKYVTDVQQGVAAQTGTPLSLRQLYRSAARYPSFAEAHNQLIEAAPPLVIPR